MLWDEDFTWKNPIALGYTRGHFSALVPMERPNYANYAGAGANVEWNEDDAHVTYLPLIDHEGHLLPVHFLTIDEVKYLLLFFSRLNFLCDNNRKNFNEVY